MHVIHVLELGEPSQGDDEGTSAQPTSGAAAVESVTEDASAAGLATETARIESGGAIHEAIVEYAERHHCDCIVMGTHGRTGIDRFILGSVAEQTVRDSPIPVLTVHEDTVLDGEFSTLLVPTDGSDSARRALDHAIALAAATGATVHLLHVIDAAMTWGDVDTVQFLDELESIGETLLEDRAAVAREGGVDSVETSLASGTPHREIRDFAADNDVSCVVMGTHGRTGLDRYLLGSVTERVLRLCEQPVLTVDGRSEGEV